MYTVQYTNRLEELDVLIEHLNTNHKSAVRKGDCDRRGQKSYLHPSLFPCSWFMFKCSRKTSMLLNKVIFFMLYSTARCPLYSRARWGGGGAGGWPLSTGPNIYIDQWVLAARARPCAARTRLLELIAMPNGRCAPHPPIAASLLLIRPPKINKIHETRAARVKGFPENKCFSSSSNLGLPHQGLCSFHWTTQAMKQQAPCPAHRSFADPSGNVLGSKLCTGATIRPNFYRFFPFFIQFFDLFFLFFSSYSSLLFNFFLFISSYPSLLISSYSSHSSRTILCLLLFLYFNLFVVLQTCRLII